MTIAVLDANGSTAQVLSAAELTAALGNITTAVGALAPFLDGLEAGQTAINTLLSTSAPADNIFAITPSDSLDLVTIPDALLVTAAGTLSIKGSSGTTVSLGTVAVGSVVPVRARRVMATGTSATVVGLN